MTDRAVLMARFIETTDWAGTRRGALAGDASNRKYERLYRDTGETAVLMDAPPAKGEDTKPFLKIARHLSALGLSAPRILAEDTVNGFLLLEDLGDALFARAIPDAPQNETLLYQSAADTLDHLHRAPLPESIKPYDVAVMTKMAGLAYGWYRTGILGADATAQSRFETTFTDILHTYAPDQTVLILRDFHAENLLWLPDRETIARVGLLDFQDAMAGHPAYDLVSMLQDARRDVPALVEHETLAHYIAISGQNAETFTAAYHVLGLQRNLRILGVFARLSMHFAKPHYVDFIPRVWAHIQTDLAHPALAPIADRLRADLPEPTPNSLQRLKDLCGTVPTL